MSVFDKCPKCGKLENVEPCLCNGYQTPAEAFAWKVMSLANSWVIAEQTINCKHTYSEITEECRRFLKTLH